MAPRKRAHSPATGAAQAPGDNVKKRRTAVAGASKKRKRASDAPNECETSQAGQSKAKRPKVWSRVVGRLAGLMELPVDILFEIFGHLMPLDVLRLARTSKQFRGMLMHRSSVSIWIAARRNVHGLPDCPPYMSEPQFANLVFDTHCHECLTPNIRSVEWRIARRICSKCAKHCMVEGYSLFVGGGVCHSVPCKYGKRRRPCYYSKDLQEFQTKRETFTNTVERDKFDKERQALVSQMEKHGALLEKWAANQAKGRLEHLDDLRRERKEAIIDKLKELGWGSEIEQIPYRDDLTHHRLVKQPTRLTPRIWANIRDEIIAYMQRMKAQRLERERKELVISRKRIAVTILRAYKISHLPPTDVMPEPMDFCTIPQISEILELPTETEVTEETFAPIVEKMDGLIGEWRAEIVGSLVQKVKDSSRTAHSTLLEGLADSSSADPTGKGKAKAIDPPEPDDAQIIQRLSLATTVFNCKSCDPRINIHYDFFDYDMDTAFGYDSDYSSSEDDFLDPWLYGSTTRRTSSMSSPLFYPKVLGHSCLTKQNTWDSSSGDPTKQYEYPMGTRTRWNGNFLQVDEKASQMAANIVSICGLDPKMTTVVEMDQLDPLLACLECLLWSDDKWDEAEASVFNWRAAIAHNTCSHPSRTHARWELIVEERASEVVHVDRESKTLAMFAELGLPPPESMDIISNPSRSDEFWLCAHCMDLPMENGCLELSKVKDHLSVTHSIMEPQENQDYYKDYEAPQGRMARTPKRKITLSMTRPSDVPEPGKRRFAFSSCCLSHGFGGEDSDGDYEGDYEFDSFF